VTRLPLDNLLDLAQWRFWLMRKIFFPRSPIDLATLTDRARALDALVLELAARRGAVAVAQRRAWYGFDPLHITYGQLSRAWSEVLAHWSSAGAERPLVRVMPGRVLYFNAVFPERRKLFGFEQRRAQPGGKLRDGTTLWFY
jgi:hypothetical protein